jgi:hypothetical protein
MLKGQRCAWCVKEWFSNAPIQYSNDDLDKMVSTKDTLKRVDSQSSLGGCLPIWGTRVPNPFSTSHQHRSRPATVLWRSMVNLLLLYVARRKTRAASGAGLLPQGCNLSLLEIRYDHRFLLKVTETGILVVTGVIRYQQSIRNTPPRTQPKNCAFDYTAKGRCPWHSQVVNYEG